MDKLKKVGFGMQAIPSPVNTELCGYGYYLKRVCDDVIDGLCVRCIALSSDKDKSLVFSADLIGLTEELHLEIRKLMADSFGYMGREVMLLCTHTHTGPATNYLEGCGEMDSQYNSLIPAVFLTAAAAALADMTDVEGIEEACRHIDPIGYNRNMADGSHDSFVRGVLIRRKKKTPVAVVSYPCHPVVIGPKRQCSADYPGAVCRIGEEKGMKAIFLNGCCGDIDPLVNRDKWGSGTQKTAEQYADRIINGFLNGLHPSKDTELKNIEFNTVLPLKELDASEVNAIATLGANAQVAEVWRMVMLADMPPASDNIMVRGIRIGPVSFISFPFETFTLVGDIVRQAYPDRNIAVLGCADHTKSYLPLITPELQYSYPAVAAAMIYAYPLIAPGAAESIGKQIADGMAEMFKVDLEVKG